MSRHGLCNIEDQKYADMVEDFNGGVIVEDVLIISYSINSWIVDLYVDTIIKNIVNTPSYICH